MDTLLRTPPGKLQQQLLLHAMKPHASNAVVTAAMYEDLAYDDPDVPDGPPAVERLVDRDFEDPKAATEEVFDESDMQLPK